MLCSISFCPVAKKIIWTFLKDFFAFSITFQTPVLLLNIPHREHTAVLYTFVSFMSLTACHCGRRTIFCFRIQYEEKNMTVNLRLFPVKGWAKLSSEKDHGLKYAVLEVVVSNLKVDRRLHKKTQHKTKNP